MSTYFKKNYSDGFFDVSNNGFIPIKEPLHKLPERYSKLQDLIDNLYITKDNNNGILSIPNKIVESVNGLPFYAEMTALETDIFIIQALFRSFAIL